MASFMEQTKNVDRSKLRRVRAQCVAAKRRADIGDDIRWGLILKLAAGLSVSEERDPSVACPSQSEAESESKDQHLANGHVTTFTHHVQQKHADASRMPSQKAAAEWGHVTSGRVAGALAGVFARALEESSGDEARFEECSCFDEESSTRADGSDVAESLTTATSLEDDSFCHTPLFVPQAPRPSRRVPRFMEMPASESGPQWEAEGQTRVAQAFAGAFARALHDDECESEESFCDETCIVKDFDVGSTEEPSCSDCCPPTHATATATALPASEAGWGLAGGTRVAESLAAVFARALHDCEDDSDCDDFAEFQTPIDSSQEEPSKLEWTKEGEMRMANAFAGVFARALDENSESD